MSVDMDVHGYPWIWISMDIHRKSVDMDMDMDVKFHIHGNPANITTWTNKVIILGRPFVKRFALCHRSVVCPVCLSV